MREEHIRWYSHSLNHEMSMLVFGEKGIPIVVFPTSMGMHNENKDFKLIESAKWFIDNGLIKIYCPDSIDKHSWYNKEIHPSTRAYNHSLYDKMLHEELVPRMKADTGHGRIVTAGCSFGGYHAANYAFKHPENVSHLISMGAAFDIRNHVKGHYDDHIYYNNPVDFLKDNNATELWNMKIVLGTTNDDMCRGSNELLSSILHQKGIKHWLDIRQWGGHDWPVWREMFPHYLSQL